MINLDLENQEFIDVVNENDKIIESRSRYDVHHLGLLHREVHVWLFDDDQNIYFQKSPVHKSSAGLFDASIGGHLTSGEDYISTAIRETKEESGLSITASDLVFLTKFAGILEHKTKKTINNFIRSIYIYRNSVTNGEIKGDPKETDGFHKFSIDYLANLNKKDMLLFHRFVPTHELPYVINYLKK